MAMHMDTHTHTYVCMCVYIYQTLICFFHCLLQISRLEREFSSYKIRAHALLQKKDAELAAAKDSEQIKALGEALKV